MISILIDLSHWLSSVHLFADAYEIVIAEPSRWWWSQQIFLSALPWGVFVGYEGGRRRIGYLWAYVLLGQMVAMSVAAGLFFWALVASGRSEASRHERASNGWGRRNDESDPRVYPESCGKNTLSVEGKGRLPTKSSLPPLLVLVLSISLAISYLAVSLLPNLSSNGPTSTAFLCALLLPHFQLFLPVLLIPKYLHHQQTPASQPSRTETENIQISKGSEGQISNLYILCGILSFVCHARATYSALFSRSPISSPNLDIEVGRNMRMVLESMWDHPAVSSVSFDVLLFGIGCAVWRGVSGRYLWDEKCEKSEGRARNNEEVDKEGIAWALAVMGLGSVGLNGILAFRRIRA